MLLTCGHICLRHKHNRAVVCFQKGIQKQLQRIHPVLWLKRNVQLVQQACSSAAPPHGGQAGAEALGPAALLNCACCQERKVSQVPPAVSTSSRKSGKAQHSVSLQRAPRQSEGALGPQNSCRAMGTWSLCLAVYS